MAAYRRVDGFKSPASWLPVHRDQLRAQRSVTSMGELYPVCKGGDGGSYGGYKYVQKIPM